MPVLGAFHSRLQPVSYVVIVDVHELRTDRTTIGMTQLFDDLFERSEVVTKDGARRKLLLKIGRQAIRTILD